MGGKSKSKAKENEEFDAFLKDLQKTTKHAGKQKQQAHQKVDGAVGGATAVSAGAVMTNKDRAEKHKERKDAIEKAKSADVERMLERKVQQMQIQQLIARMQEMQSPFLSAPETQIQGETKGSSSFDCAAARMQGWRRAMEDEHVIDLDVEPAMSMFAVFDGHSGTKCSSLCKVLLPALVRQNYDAKAKDFGLDSCYKSLDTHMDGKLPDSSGSTAVTVLINKERVVCANVGDSRAVLCREGKAVSLSNDHKPDDEAEGKRIVAAGGHVENNRVNGQLAMSRAIGDFTYKGNDKFAADEQLVISVPEVIAHDLAKGKDEFLVLGCDGIFDVLSNEEVVAFVHEQLYTKLASVKEACEELIKACMAPVSPAGTPARAEGTDNMTVVIAKFL